MQMKNVYLLQKIFNFFSTFANLIYKWVLFFSYEWKILEKINDKKTYFKKLRKKIFKIFSLSKIFNKNSWKFREFSGLFLQDLSRHFARVLI